jgi:hypothetical protein
MYEDSLRAGPAFENPLSSQSFDPVTGKARPGTAGRLRYYKEAGFPLGTRPTLEQIKNTALQQPNGMKGYNKLVKEDYPWGVSPYIPTKEQGGQYDFSMNMQEGGTAYVDSVLNANKGLNWVQRLYPKNTPSMQIPGQRGRSTHFMESGDGRVYPTVVQMPNGSLKYLGKDAFNYADSTKSYIQFPSDTEATWFGNNYKKGTGVLPKNASGGQHGGLDRWFAEKWVDVKTGKDCGRQERESRAGYPACRPSKRVNSQTPKTSSEMSSAEKAKFKASKTSSQRIDYNHKRNK